MFSNPFMRSVRYTIPYECRYYRNSNQSELKHYYRSVLRLAAGTTAALTTVRATSREKESTPSDPSGQHTTVLWYTSIVSRFILAFYSGHVRRIVKKDGSKS